MRINLQYDLSPTASSWVGLQVWHGLVLGGHDVAVQNLDGARVDEPYKGGLRVVVRPLVRLTPELCEDAVVVTLWESDGVSEKDVSMLNLCRAVLVPCRWLAGVFRGAGVSTPIHVVNYGVSSEYTPSSETFPKRTVFLAAGRTLHGRVRKGVDRVMAAFLLAFPNEPDVCLQVKTDHDCPVMEVVSSRIQVIRGTLTVQDMARWYQQGLCYVSGSAGEAWGLHMHEAMACGKPAISGVWGGVSEYFDPPNNGYALRVRMTDSELGVGKWAIPEIDSLVARMRFVYENPVSAFVVGLAAAQSVEALTVDAMRKNHAKVIVKYG